MNLNIRTTFFFLFLGIYVNINAQEDSCFNCNNKYSIQLAINDQVSFKDFEGYYFNFKYNFNRRNAIRVGYNIISNSIKTNIIHYSGAGSLKSINDKLNYDISCHYIYYFPFNRINLYSGIGPFYSYEFEDVDWFQKQAAQANFHFTKNIKYYTNRYGISVIFGLEYYIIKYLSMITEFELISIKSYMKEEHLILGISKKNEILFKSNGIKVGFSINF